MCNVQCAMVIGMKEYLKLVVWHVSLLAYSVLFCFVLFPFERIVLTPILCCGMVSKGAW
jgi:hypothetical protein